MTTRNPEFQRQLWLNWRPSLMVWSLCLSALILALPLALAAPDRRAASLGMTALAGLWLAAVGYGSVLAGRSLREEASQNTWDWQRLSALSPWQMGWGKLLGAAVPAWLYALWFALVMLFVSATWPQVARIGGLRLGLHAVALAALWGLGVQAWAMNSVLVAWGQQARPADSRQAQWLPLLLVWMSASLLVRGYAIFTSGKASSVLWWGMDIGYLGAAYLSGAFLLALGLLALWRLLCMRLDVRTLPWAWPLGLAACGFFTAGAVAGDADLKGAGPDAFAGATFLFAAAGTVLIALMQMDGHLRDWRQAQWAASRGRWRQALQALPLWPVSWLLALAASVAPALWAGKFDQTFFLPLICLHLLRDCLILTGFALLAGRLRSPLAVFCIVWAVINIALPLLARSVAGPAGASLAQPVIELALRGFGAWGIHGIAPWASLGVQLLLAAGWAGWIFRDRVLGFARERGKRAET